MGQTARWAMAGDWIKVHRSLMDSAVWGDEWLVKLWLWCLMKANHCDGNFRGTRVLRGQFITGRNTASDELGVSPSKWYRGIERLVSLGNIEIQANSVWTMVTVCNYKTYQDDSRQYRTADEQRADSERTASGQPADTSKNVITKELPDRAKPIRRFAAEESTAAIPNSAGMAAIRIEPLPKGDITNGQATKSIPSDIGNLAAVADWWRRHLSSDKPLTGDTALDLIQVLCLATEAARSGNRVTNKVGWFAKRLTDGTWLGSATNVHQIRDWLNDHINAGKVTLVKRDKVTA